MLSKKQSIAVGSITATLHHLPQDPLTGALAVPIYQTATFVQDAPGQHKGYDYARTANPTRAALESLIAHLEQADAGFAFSSGLAAIDAVVKLLKAGDEIIAVDDIYGGAYRQFVHIYQKLGIQLRFVDTTNAENIKLVLSPQTKMIWIESPTNPTLKISDIEAIVKIAKAYSPDILVVVDNTFASPALQQPLSLGADIVVHSGTKYLGGHSDLIAGLVLTKNKALSEQIKFIQNACGAILSPHDSWLLIRGIETLHLRVDRQCKSAYLLAHYLSTHQSVAQVYYPGLTTHHNHKIAAEQQSAFGAIISFTLKEDSCETAHAVVRNTQYFKLAESLGGVKSLICHPASMTHKSIPEAQRKSVGISDSLIRLSVGIEDVQDLILDLEQALSTNSNIEQAIASDAVENISSLLKQDL